MSDLLIKINADAKNAKAAFDDLKSQTEDLEGTLATIAKGSAIAFAALTAEVGLATHAFQESDQASRQLNITLQNQGIYSVQLEQSYKNRAAAIQQLTGFDDDAIVKGQALLQNFIGQKQITDELAQAAIELGQANGGDVAAGFETLGRAINGNSRVLKQFGITIDDNLSKSERQARIIELVNLKLGGQAEAALKAGGGMRLFLASLSDVQEELGQRFAPAVEKAIGFATRFLQAFKENEGLVNLAAGLIGAGVAITGFIAIAAGLAPVFIAANAAAAAFGVTVSVIAGPIALAAAAIIALGAAVGIYVANSGKAKSATEELDKQITVSAQNVEILRKRMGDPIQRFFNPSIDDEFQKAKDNLADLEERRRKFNSAETQKNAEVDVDPAKKAQADKEAAFEKQRDEKKQAALKAHQEVMKLENQHASEDLIALKREEAAILDQQATEDNEKTLALLQERYEQKVVLEEEQRAQDAERDAAYREIKDATDAELAQKDIDSKAALRAQDRAALEADLLTEKEAERKVAIEITQERIKRRNEELEDRKKYGIAVATINATLRSEEVQGVKSATAELVQLQNSKNATLKQIGKVAAVAQITIKTAESAVNVFNGFSTIPIIGPALGCLHPNSLIETDRGPLPLCTLQSSFFNVVVRGKTYRAFAFYTGEKEAWGLWLESGKKLSASADHKLYNGTDWVRLEDLKIGDKIETATGYELVTNVLNLNFKIGMYDVSVDDEFHAFYAAGILVHNTAAAAAVIAYGAEQIGNVVAAKEGGLVTGGIPGIDSVPILAEPGELIVPSKLTPTFLDVVGSGGIAGAQSSGGGGSTSPEILATLQSIDSKLTQPSQTIIQGDVLADGAFIDALISKINDRLQYGNAQLVGANGATF